MNPKPPTITKADKLNSSLVLGIILTADGIANWCADNRGLLTCLALGALVVMVSCSIVGANRKQARP